MTLILNDTEVLGHGLNISAVFDLSAKDISGESSRSEEAETGDKPKSMSVRMEILYKNAVQLKTLVELAGAKNEQQQRVIYNILNSTAEAMSIRQVRFSGPLRVREDFSREKWHVSFKFSEVLTVPELIAIGDAVNNPQTAEEQAAAGEPVVPVIAGPDFSDFEKVLNWIEEQITPEAEPVANAT